LKPRPYKDNPNTLCEHLRKRRLELGIFQREAALRLGVNEWTYHGWENGRTTPGTIIYQRIVEFLGYYPHPTPRTLGHRLRKIRRCLGLTSRQAARLVGVDHTTFLMWELGKWEPTVRTRLKLECFLAQHELLLPMDCSVDGSAAQDPVYGVSDTRS